MDTLVFLGTGDAMGVPRVYCSCETCMEARSSGDNARLRTSVLIDNGSDFWIIDCGPDWRRQMELQGRRSMRRLLVTHPHFDHIGGLPEWADSCRTTGAILIASGRVPNIATTFFIFKKTAFGNGNKTGGVVD